MGRARKVSGFLGVKDTKEGVWTRRRAEGSDGDVEGKEKRTDKAHMESVKVLATEGPLIHLATSPPSRPVPLQQDKSRSSKPPLLLLTVRRRW